MRSVISFPIDPPTRRYFGNTKEYTPHLNQNVPFFPEFIFLFYFYCDSIYLSIYGSAALADRGRFFILLMNTQLIGSTPWTGGQPVARPLPTHRINAHRHPCLNWDSSPRSQRSRWCRRFMPGTSRKPPGVSSESGLRPL
jgi:hypothetical protein